MGSVRLEESGEWSGGVPECRTAHAAHQQRVERGGRRPAPRSLVRYKAAKRILLANSLAQHWARDWRALALTQVHHGSRLSDSCEGGEALSSVHPPTPATGKLIHDLLCDGRVKND